MWCIIINNYHDWKYSYQTNNQSRSPLSKYSSLFANVLNVIAFPMNFIWIFWFVIWYSVRYVRFAQFHSIEIGSQLAGLCFVRIQASNNAFVLFKAYSHHIQCQWTFNILRASRVTNVFFCRKSKWLNWIEVKEWNFYA